MKIRALLLFVSLLLTVSCKRENLESIPSYLQPNAFQQEAVKEWLLSYSKGLAASELANVDSIVKLFNWHLSKIEPLRGERWLISIPLQGINDKQNRKKAVFKLDAQKGKVTSGRITNVIGSATIDESITGFYNGQKQLFSR